MTFVASVLLLGVVLALPERFLGSDVQLGFPLELPLLLAALWAIPARWRRHAAALGAVALVFGILLRLAHTATFVAFDRPFDITGDVVLAPAGIGFLIRSQGLPIVLAAGAAILVVLGALSALLYAALRRSAVPPARTGAIAVALVVAVVMVVAARDWTGASTASVFADAGRAARDGLRADATFRLALAEEPQPAIADDKLYAALRGHDVLVIFAESYGRVAIDDPRYAAFTGQLDALSARLEANNFGARSAWMTSPTFGGQSWLAHGTLLGGLRVPDHRRFKLLIASDRSTMIQDFSRAGWRTVVMMPEINGPWETGRYLAPEMIYDGPSLKFAGAPFAYVTMPDQFALAALQTKELAPTDRKPVMATVGLVSGHAPWTPLPKVIPWDQIGDGKIFNRARKGGSPDDVWNDPEAIYRQYGLAMSYVTETLESFVVAFARDNTVVFVIGDHQPMAFVAGKDATREVPVHVIARDPAVLAAIADWHWTEGMRPDTTSPVWPMEAFRTRFTHTFSSGP